MIIGIDASRNRSGGARAHIIGILHNIEKNLLAEKIEEIHVWSYSELLDLLPVEKWLIKHSPIELNQNIFNQIWWQYRKLPEEAKKNKIDILLNTDASTVCRYKPSVTMSRDMLSYEKGEKQRYGLSKQRLRLELIKYFQNYSLMNSTAAIFLTEYAAKVIQTSSGAIKKFRVINHGVSENFRIQTNNGVWGKDEKKIIHCVYVSNLDLYKHQWNVALAIEGLRNEGYNIVIDFIGGGAGKPKIKFDEALTQIKDNAEFIFQHEYITHKELPYFLKDKDIFVFASSCENMPNTLIEGMASGLPIACSNRGPMPEVLKDGGVYFNPENVKDIEKAISIIIENLDERERIAQRAEELSKAYSWARCSKETFEFLIEIALQNKK